MGSSPAPSSPPIGSGHVVYVCYSHRSELVGFSNWIECYHPASNTWSHVSEVPTLLENHVLKGFAMTALGERIYIVGGQLCTSDDHDGAGGVHVSPSVLCYDVRSDRWSDCAPLSVPRYDFACTVCDGKIYVAGGKSELASVRGVSFAEVYDPDSGTWTSLPNMSTLRYKCVGVTWQGKIHVVGGFAEKESDDDGRNNMLKGMRERSSAEVYDTSTGKWEVLPGMWPLDVPPNQIVDVDGKLFSSGDCLKPWKGHIEAFNGKLWDEVAGSRYQFNSQVVSSGSGHHISWPQFEPLYLTMAPVGNCLYFLAGYRKVGDSSPKPTLSKVYIFDTTARATHAWRSYEPSAEEGEKELCSHCCVLHF